MGCRAAVLSVNQYPQSPIVKGIACLAYPLHKPGTSELRDQPVLECKLPMLFVSGTSDNFAVASRLEEVVKKVKRARLEWIEGGDHSHKVKGKTVEEVSDIIGALVKDWCEGVTGQMAGVKQDENENVL